MYDAHGEHRYRASISLMLGGERGWRSGESTRLPPLWFRVRLMDPASYVGHFIFEGGRGGGGGGGLSLLLVLVLALQDFSPGLRFFFPPQKPSFPNSNSIWNSRATGLSVEDY